MSTTPTPWSEPYGSDAHGLICAYAFADGAAPRPIDLREALEHLKPVAQSTRLAPTDDMPPAQGFLWLHFNLNDASVRTTLKDALGLAPEFLDALQQGSRSTRIENVPPVLVAVVNDVAYEFAFDPSEIASLWIQASPHLVVTARTHPLRSIDRLRTAVRHGKSFPSTVALVAELLQDQGHVLEHIVREATDTVDGIEDGLLSGRWGQKRRDLGSLRRVLVRLERLLAPEPGALSRLMRHPPEWMDSADLDELRQTSDEMALVLNDLAGLKERIKLLQEEIAAQAAEQSNRSLFALTAFTVLALPINMVAGLMGMNVGGIPLAEHPQGFAWIAAGVVSVTATAGAWFWWRSRREG